MATQEKPAKAAPRKKAAPKKEQPKGEVEMVKGSYKPEALAAEIGVTGKNLRAWLRRNHPRAAEAKNTAWIIPPDVVKEARQAFKKQEAK